MFKRFSSPICRVGFKMRWVFAGTFRFHKNLAILLHFLTKIRFFWVKNVSEKGLHPKARDPWFFFKCLYVPYGKSGSANLTTLILLQTMRIMINFHNRSPFSFSISPPLSLETHNLKSGNRPFPRKYSQIQNTVFDPLNHN